MKKFSLSEIEKMFPEAVCFEKNSSSEHRKRQRTESLTDFDLWYKTLPLNEGGDNCIGGRNQTITVLVSEALGCKLSYDVIKFYVEDYCNRSGVELEVGLDILDRLSEKHKTEPFKRIYSKSAKLNLLETAKEFIDSNLTYKNTPAALVNNEMAWVYEAGVYIKIKKKELGIILQKSIQNQYSNIKQSNVTDVLGHIVALLYTKDLPKWGAYLGKTLKFHLFINMKDSVLLLNSDYLVQQAVEQSPDFFTQSKLAYNFNSSATCSKFDSILNFCFGDDELTKKFVYEWFGYCLIHSTMFSKALLMVGEGANGKSVIALVLELLVGSKNVSHIGPESFDPKRSFSLSVTEGKLVNICPDVNEIEKINEGTLRAFISGEPMQVEDKHCDPRTIIPTARIVMTANQVPRFSDTTDGNYRRFIILPFVNQILDESKQDVRFKEPSWWLESGELEGVFNKSLEGLARLMKRGKFIEPEISVRYKNNLRVETNSVRSFVLQDYEQGTQNDEIICQEIYSDYRKFCEKNGNKPVQANRFYSELQRVYKNVNRSPNPVMRNGIRSHVLSGIKRHPDLPGCEF